MPLPLRFLMLVSLVVVAAGSLVLIRHELRRDTQIAAVDSVPSPAAADVDGPSPDTDSGPAAESAMEAAGREAAAEVAEGATELTEAERRLADDTSAVPDDQTTGVADADTAAIAETAGEDAAVQPETVPESTQTAVEAEPATDSDLAQSLAAPEPELSVAEADTEPEVAADAVADDADLPEDDTSAPASVEEAPPADTEPAVDAPMTEMADAPAQDGNAVSEPMAEADSDEVARRRDDVALQPGDSDDVSGLSGTPEEIVAALADNGASSDAASIGSAADSAAASEAAAAEATDAEAAAGQAQLGETDGEASEVAAQPAPAISTEDTAEATPEMAESVEQVATPTTEGMPPPGRESASGETAGEAADESPTDVAAAGEGVVSLPPADATSEEAADIADTSDASAGEPAAVAEVAREPGPDAGDVAEGSSDVAQTDGLTTKQQMPMKPPEIATADAGADEEAVRQSAGQPAMTKAAGSELEVGAEQATDAAMAPVAEDSTADIEPSSADDEDSGEAETSMVAGGPDAVEADASVGDATGMAATSAQDALDDADGAGAAVAAVAEPTDEPAKMPSLEDSETMAGDATADAAADVANVGDAGVPDTPTVIAESATTDLAADGVTAGPAENVPALVVDENGQSVEETETAVALALPADETADSATPGSAPAAVDVPVVPPQFDVVRVERSGESVIAGRGSPGAEIEILANDRVIASVTAGPSGEWVVLPDEPLPPGPHEISARARTGDGVAVMSEDRIAVSVPEQEDGGLLVMRTSPDAPSEVIARDAGADAVSTPEATEDTSAMPVIETVEADDGRLYAAGTAPEKTTVRIYAENEFVGETEADEYGRWYLQTDKPLGTDAVTVRVDQIGADGSVIGRAEVPFQRPQETSVASAAVDEDAGDAMVVATPAEGAAEPTTIRIRRGDNLWTIARRTYGRGIRYTMIYEANADQIRDPHWIYPGQVFELPKFEGDDK